ncbi:GGDEF domain-containing protein [Rhodoferax aquaticus]|uniref:diguanylate cyclase n=1 Tax=Rhodoferax aquaticus TaxID=2527691 RepID=A0A515EU58_9BURK|nr:diguanylate cyclase [Rhodoferax aquaticus]QDL56215.1 diguanylate cyclase [Rhodoferax aquaticus]
MVKNSLRMLLAGLGIGPRIVLIFALVFSSMGGLGLVLMRNSLLPAFERMERDVALQSAWRVVSGFEQHMSSLADMNRDWALWDELYFHLQRADPVFERSNFGPEAMQSVKYHAVLLLDLSNQVAGFGSRAFSGGMQAQVQDLAVPLLERLTVSPVQPQRTECGLARVARVLSAVCWTGILQSNGQGPMVGTVVMARELDADSLKDIARFAGATFTLEQLGANHTPVSAQGAWTLPALTYLSNTQLPAQFSANAIAMQYLLHDLNEKPLAQVRIHMGRELMTHGRNVIQDVLFQLATVAFATGLVLLLTVHWWLVHPVSRLRRALAKISHTKRWDKPLVVDRPDEIGALTQGINSLLSVLRKQVDALEETSSTDALTGISNRRRFDLRLDDELARLGRRTGALSLLLLDIDHFKRYNDRYGHPQGDAVLRQFGALLGSSCRRQDLPARVGGEEFALILPDTDEAGAKAMADKIMESLATLALEHDASPTASVVTVSMGVATWSVLQAGGDETFYAQADKALYAAKHLGRNRVCAYGSPYVPSL